MTIKETYTPGTFSWVDLMAHNAAEVTPFYTGLFGWEAKPQDTQGGPPYTMFAHNGQVVAGMGQMPDAMKEMSVPPLWNSYISVADIDATLAKISAAGGAVTMPKMPIMEAGSMAVCADPEGAAFSLWQPNNHIGATLVNEPGSFSWNELACRKDETQDFYAGVFGWTFEKQPGPMNYTQILNDGQSNGGIIKMNEQWGEMPAHWMVYFAVANCDASCEQVKTLGGKVCVPPTDIPPGRFAVVNDPQGGTFTVIALKAADS